MATAWEWFTAKLHDIPPYSRDFVDQVWSTGGLRLRGRLCEADGIAEWSSRLACAALERGRSLLLILPSGDLDAGAVILANALCLQWWRDRARQSTATVLYFGAELGIRDALSQIRMGDLLLSTVFPQTHLASRSGHVMHSNRQETAAGNQPPSPLPRLVCSCQPAAPAAIVEHYDPRWLAADLGTGLRIQWLDGLIEASAKKHLPLIAWCRNPLSPAVQRFRDSGALVFSWAEGSTERAEAVSARLAHSLVSLRTAGVTAAILTGDAPNELSYHLAHAGAALTHAMRESAGRLTQEAVSIGWRWRRLIETLSVPVDLYAAEAPNYWQARTFETWSQALTEFRRASAGAKGSVRNALEEAHAHLDEASTEASRSEQAMWLALSDAASGPDDEDVDRLLIFPSCTMRRMFEFALLAYYGIDNDALASRKVVLTDVSTLRRQPCSSAPDGHLPLASQTKAMLAGLPSAWSSPALYPVLGCSTMRVTLYPHQLGGLLRMISAFDAALSPDLPSNAQTLSALCDSRCPAVKTKEMHRVTLASAEYVHVPTSPPDDERSPRLWQPPSLEGELGHLLADPETGDEWQDDDDRSGEGSDSTAADTSPIVLDECIQVVFVTGESVRLAIGETLQVIFRSGGEVILQERHASSLRSGDQVLFIQGQRRQSLYDLLVSRLHRTDAVRVHLALVDKWHSELRQAHEAWRRSGRTTEDLLAQIRLRGSTITTAQAIGLWVSGATIAPDDAEDLVRIAGVLGLSFVGEHHRRIYKSATRLRGLHRGLANRLNQWLTRKASQLIGEQEDLLLDEVFDPELGLTLRDFSASLLLLTVKSISREAGPFSADEMGRIIAGRLT